jgi:hypothetical protein
MLARRLTTMLPAMTLAEALETTRIHRVAGRTVDCTALVTTCPSRAPHHTISDAGLIGGGHVATPGKCRWPTMACSCWMNSPSFAVMCSESCASRSRMVSYEYNLAGVLDLPTVAALAARIRPSTTAPSAHLSEHPPQPISPD